MGFCPRAGDWNARNFRQRIGARHAPVALCAADIKIFAPNPKASNSARRPLAEEDGNARSDDEGCAGERPQARNFRKHNHAE
jgi:hypothetical protein